MRGETVALVRSSNEKNETRKSFDIPLNVLDFIRNHVSVFAMMTFF